MKIKIYTDGSCKMKRGFVGGWATIIKLNDKEVILSGSCRNTTNNRMELLAAIKGLEYIKEPSNIVIISDSQYLVNSINKGWLFNWERIGWKRKDGTDTLNMDLWKRMLNALRKHENVSFEWVRGHNNNPDNEKCDRIACEEAEALLKNEDKYSYNEIVNSIV